MKKSVLFAFYTCLVTIVAFLSSCSKESFHPAGSSSNLKMDTTWVDDSLGGFNFDFTPHGNSSVWDDSTWTNPNDSTWNPGGGGNGGNQLDSIWFGYTPHGGSPVCDDSTWTNPNDTLGGGN